MPIRSRINFRSSGLTFSPQNQAIVSSGISFPVAFSYCSQRRKPLPPSFRRSRASSGASMPRALVSRVAVRSASASRNDQ